MHPTPYSDVNEILAEIQRGISSVLDDTLIGLYLYGSLTYDGYTAGVSDLDLLAALNDDLDRAAIPSLTRMHAEIVARHPEWSDRIEVIYLSRQGLQTYKTQRSPIAVISPGEPLHFREEQAGDDWLMNWYLVLEHGQVIYGPPAEEIIVPASTDEFVKSVREHARDSVLWIDNLKTSKARSYAVLTMCRTLYTDRNREHVSKQVAANWVANQLPEFRDLIDDALTLRVTPHEAAEASGKVSMAETKRFVTTIREHLGVA
ncbi:MAG: aminoglycoside adenylyltransferase domain-containing protein [Thermomicrobiales bacterium]